VGLWKFNAFRGGAFNVFCTILISSTEIRENPSPLGKKLDSSVCMLIIAPHSRVFWMSDILISLHCLNEGKMTGKFFASTAGDDGCLNCKRLL